LSDTVYLSVALQEVHITSGCQMEDRVVPSSERSQNAMAHLCCQMLAPELLPQRAIEDRGRPVRSLPALFMVNGFLCVTDKAAQVLRDHDLGKGGLYNLELFRSDGQTPITGPFWALNFGEKKSALNLAESKGLARSPQDRFSPSLLIQPDDVAVTAAALQGADLWGDEKLVSGFFVSPKLAKALFKAKLDKAFYLVSCRVVPE
jgi:hypothetical protein